MSKAKLTNIAASVRQRLLNLSRQRVEGLNVIMTRYAMQRLLYRLELCGEVQRFVLKGAMVFPLWSGREHRPTKDLDLLGHGAPSPQRLAELFEKLYVTEEAGDGLEFDSDSIAVEEIRGNQEYGGLRVKSMATLAGARIPIQVDVGFGDVVTPAPVEVEYPTLLDMPAPRIRAYTKQSVVAEKLQAMVVLGMQNSRMKDFFDLWVMAKEFAFGGQTLVDAIRATFDRRTTDVPHAVPIGLAAEFSGNADKVVQWQAFLRRSSLDAPMDLSVAICTLREFLRPPLIAAAKAEPFAMSWPPGGPWS